jgi:hypothetical protein
MDTKKSFIIFIRSYCLIFVFFKYIRVENETKTNEMIQHMYSQEGWNLQKPELIISVTGGAQKFTIPHRMKKAFKRGLIKAAASTGAWIVSNKETIYVKTY